MEEEADVSFERLVSVQRDTHSFSNSELFDEFIGTACRDEWRKTGPGIGTFRSNLYSTFHVELHEGWRVLLLRVASFVSLTSLLSFTLFGVFTLRSALTRRETYSRTYINGGQGVTSDYANAWLVVTRFNIKILWQTSTGGGCKETRLWLAVDVNTKRETRTSTLVLYPRRCSIFDAVRVNDFVRFDKLLEF